MKHTSNILSGAIFVFATVIHLVGCGDQDSPKADISGVCDLDRELQDCFDDGQYLVNGRDASSFADLCSITCNEVASVSLSGINKQQLDVLRAFDTVYSLKINGADESITDLSPLRGQTTMNLLIINGCDGLRSFDGLESLRTIKPIGEPWIPNSSVGFMIRDCGSLESISLPSLQQGNLEISGGGNLREIEVSDTLDSALISVTGTALETFRGANETTHLNGGFTFERNPWLTRIDAFENLESAGGAAFIDNASLPCSEIEPIVNGIERTAELYLVVSGNKEPCDIE